MKFPKAVRPETIRLHLCSLLESKPRSDLPLDIDRIIDVPVDRIAPNPDQPRKFFDPKKITQLGRSLLKKQRIPILVVPVKGEKYDFIICDGERRWRAAKEVGKETIQCLVMQSMSEAELYKHSAISNFGREDHTPMELAVALRRVKESDRLILEELATEFAMSVQKVSQHLALLKLSPEVRKFVDPELPEGQGLVMLAGYEVSKLPTEYQLSAAKHIVERKMGLPQVRHYVAHLIAQVGTTSKRERSPKNDYCILMTFIRNGNEKAGQILDLPGNLTIETLFRHRSWMDREAAVNGLSALAEKINKISAQIQKVDEKKNRHEFSHKKERKIKHSPRESHRRSCGFLVYITYFN